jgi:hypothetical protein
MGATGWLDGDLVECLGVDNGAHLNTPNLLAGHPASARRVTGEQELDSSETDQE